MQEIDYNHVQRIYSPGKNMGVRFIGGWIGCMAGLTVLDKRKSLVSAGIRKFLRFSSYCTNRIISMLQRVFKNKLCPVGVLRVSYCNLVTLHINTSGITKLISNRASLNFVSKPVFSLLYVSFLLTDVFRYGGQHANSSRGRSRR